MRKIALYLIMFLSAACSAAAASPAIDQVDRVRIAEVYRIGEKLQNRVWADWSTAPFGILFITDDNEFLIRHPKPNSDFVSIGYDKLLKSEVFVRPRKFQKNFLATFPAFDATPVIVVGKAENTSDKTSTRWAFVVLHEHFHQLQYSRPSYLTDSAGLGLSGGDTSGMWQINYPFPYKDETVADSFRKLTDLLSRAQNAKTADEKTLTLGAYLAARKAFADSLKPNDYKYMSFQLYQEGIARYTQIRMAELAARKAKPSKAFRSLADFTPFDKEAERLNAALRKEMLELDLKTWERAVFYPFGATEGMLLDRADPAWRSKYFSEKFALDRFYPGR